jgi:hypothetical protein
MSDAFGVFASPAVAVARSLTKAFSAIRPVDSPGFLAAELCGAAAGLPVMIGCFVNVLPSEAFETPAKHLF